MAYVDNAVACTANVDLMEDISARIATHDYAGLQKIKATMLEDLDKSTDEPLFAQLCAINDNLHEKLLCFIGEVFECLHANVWTSRTIEHIARIFGHDQVLCPQLMTRLLHSVYSVRKKRFLFGKVIPHCLGCIKSFGIEVLDYILREQESIAVMIQACQKMGCKWDTEANGCFASYLPTWVQKRRCCIAIKLKS
jgi:hypothetical protein